MKRLGWLGTGLVVGVAGIPAAQAGGMFLPGSGAISTSRWVFGVDSSDTSVGVPNGTAVDGRLATKIAFCGA